MDKSILIKFDGNCSEFSEMTPGQINADDGVLLFFNGNVVSVHDKASGDWRLVATECTRIELQVVHEAHK